MKALFFTILCLILAYMAFLIGVAILQGHVFKALLYLVMIGIIWLRLEYELGKG